MLILSRNEGESLMISDNVIITVVGLSGNQVRLGITAPKEIHVHREEIYQRIQNEKNQNGHDKIIDKLTLPIIIQKRKRKLNAINFEKSS